jgi:hypothetical protein
VPQFTNLVRPINVTDIATHFTHLAYEYGDNAGSTSTIELDVIGKEQIGGVETDHLKITMIDSGSTTVTELWIDGNQTGRKMVTDGEEVPAEYVGIFAPTFLFGIVAPFAAVPDISAYQALAAGVGSSYVLVSSSEEPKSFGQVSATAYTLVVNAIGQGQVTWEVSDFGTFQMGTRIAGESIGGMGYFAVTEVTPR